VRAHVPAAHTRRPSQVHISTQPTTTHAGVPLTPRTTTDSTTYKRRRGRQSAGFHSALQSAPANVPRAPMHAAAGSPPWPCSLRTDHASRKPTPPVELTMRAQRLAALAAGHASSSMARLAESLSAYFSMKTFMVISIASRRLVLGSQSSCCLTRRMLGMRRSESS